MSEDTHYNQPKRRDVEFINPPNTLKQKVGSGGLSDEILEKKDSASNFIKNAFFCHKKWKRGIAAGTVESTFAWYLIYHKDGKPQQNGWCKVYNGQ